MLLNPYRFRKSGRKKELISWRLFSNQSVQSPFNCAPIPIGRLPQTAHLQRYVVTVLCPEHPQLWLLLHLPQLNYWQLWKANNEQVAISFLKVAGNILMQPSVCARTVGLLSLIAWSLKVLFFAKEEAAIFNLASENDKEIYQTELGAQILPVLFSFVIQSESNQRPCLRRSAPSNLMKQSSDLPSCEH